MIQTVAALALFALALPKPDPVPLSDQVGVYALLSKVRFLPDDANIQTARSIELTGAFCVAEGKNGDYYRSPKWGWTVFHLDAEHADATRKQWQDLKKMAGSGKVVGFGFRYYQDAVPVLPLGTKGKFKVPTYKNGMGVQKTRNANYGPIAMLRHFPKPLHPVRPAKVEARGGRHPEQGIEFTCANCVAKGDDVRYVFEFEQSNGDIRGSEPLVAGEAGKTTWRTRIAMTPGKTVKWRVRVIAKGLKTAPLARASFRVNSKSD